jgi:hypothetical protein
MRTPGQKMARVFALAGCIVAAVTLLLFYQLRDAPARSEAFTFTVWFVVFQEALLFGSLALTALRSGGTSTVVPVRIGYLTTVVLYNLVALATVAIFNLVLLPQHAGPKTYYTVAIAESGLWLALLVTLQVVDIVHHASHREAEIMRDTVEQLLLTCDRIRALSDAQGWQLSQSLRELAERTRFSEGLRRNTSLVEEVSRRLDELETLVTGGGDDAAQKAAERLVKEVSIMATRRG